MNAHLKGLFDVLSSFVTRPTLSRKILRALPVESRSRRYSRQWRRHEVSPVRSPEAQSATNPLEQYFESRTQGPGIWKWRHYFDVYDRHLKQFRGTEVHVMEIGIFSGGSLQMWRDYFGPKCFLYGVDIESACKAYENEWTRVFIGDQRDRHFWRDVKQQVPKVDILIDDGGHHFEQQIATLEEMLPHLSPGGVYVTEDIHRAHNWFTAYLAGLAGELNAFQRIPGETPKELRCTATPFQSEVHSMHTYPFIAVIEKRQAVMPEFVAPTHGTEWQPFLGVVQTHDR